jgi:hypothetical protein
MLETPLQLWQVSPVLLLGNSLGVLMSSQQIKPSRKAFVGNVAKKATSLPTALARTQLDMSHLLLTLPGNASNLRMGRMMDVPPSGVQPVPFGTGQVSTKLMLYFNLNPIGYIIKPNQVLHIF